MVIYLSQSNLAAEFVCFLHDCTGRIDFSFEGKQRQVLKKCEQHRWETEGAGFLFAVPWEECYGCLHALEHEPEQKRGNRQSGLLTISASRLLKIALVVLSLGSSCINETKCNKNLVECACSRGGLSRDCWDGSLKSHNTQLSGNNDFHSLSRLFWWLRDNK